LLLEQAGEVLWILEAEFVGHLFPAAKLRRFPDTPPKQILERTTNIPDK
jgi:hypothetical protein